MYSTNDHNRSHSNNTNNGNEQESSSDKQLVPIWALAASRSSRFSSNTTSFSSSANSASTFSRGGTKASGSTATATATATAADSRVQSIVNNSSAKSANAKSATAAFFGNSLISSSPSVSSKKYQNGLSYDGKKKHNFNFCGSNNHNRHPIHTSNYIGGVVGSSTSSCYKKNARIKSPNHDDIMDTASSFSSTIITSNNLNEKNNALSTPQMLPLPHHHHHSNHYQQQQQRKPPQPITIATSNQGYNIQRELYPSSFTSTSSSPSNYLFSSSACNNNHNNSNNNTDSTNDPLMKHLLNTPCNNSNNNNKNNNHNIDDGKTEIHLHRVLNNNTNHQDDYDNVINNKYPRQEKKWIRSGHKWVLLTGNSNGYSSGSRGAVVGASASGRGNDSEPQYIRSNSESTTRATASNAFHSNSSLWTEMGQALPTLDHINMQQSHNMTSTSKPNNGGIAEGGGTGVETATSASSSPYGYRDYLATSISARNPTAVSSHWDNSGDHCRNKSRSKNTAFSSFTYSPCSPPPKNHRNDNIVNNPPTDTNNQHNIMTPTAATTTSSSSVISLSPSLLYTRRRLALTSKGFSYMPSLHLTRSSSSLHKDSNNKKSNGDGAGHGHGHENNNSNTGLEKNNEHLVHEKNNHDDYNNNNTIMPNILVSSSTKRGTESNNQFSSSSKTTKATRIRMESTLSPPKLSVRAFSDAFRNIDSDSETNERLSEWKKEQYRKSAALKKNNKINNDCNNNNIEDYSKNQPKSPKSHSLRKQSNAKTPMSKLSRNQSDSYRYTFDTGYESGSTTCERLKEWREQQYKEIDRNRGNNYSDTDRCSSDGGGEALHRHISDWGLQSARSLDSCDSEEVLTKEERMKEWKSQFGSLPLQQEKKDGDAVVGGSTNHELKQDGSINKGSATIGFFPITSPARNTRMSEQKETLDRNFPTKSTSLSLQSRRPRANMEMKKKKSQIYDSNHAPTKAPSALPPLTPPRILNRVNRIDGDNNERRKHNVQSQNEQSSEEKNQFFINLAQTQDESSSSSKTTSIICSPTDGVIDSPCQVIPKLPSADSTSEVDGIDATKSSSPVIKSVDFFKPVRSESSFSVTTGDSNCSLNPHDKNKFIPTKAWRHHRSSDLLYSWENCLYVRAEGARTGRICLSSTHLIFLYDDDIAEAAIYENKWDKKKIDIFVNGEQSSPGRSVTPVNVRQDGCGVEIIGENELRETDFFDMLEDGFEDLSSFAVEGKGNVSECVLDINEIKYVTEMNDIYNDMKTDLTGDNLSNVTGDHRVEESKSEVKSRCDDKDGTLSALPQNSLSRSQSYTVSDDSTKKEDTVKSGDESSLCDDEYFNLLNEYMVRSMKAEAQRGLAEASRDDSGNSSSVAPYSFWENLGVNNTETNNNFGSLLGNQTNVSSFSEPDLEIDPDEERRLYISSSKELKHRFVGIKWSLQKFSEIYDRRYLTKEVGLEIFYRSHIPTTTQSVRRPSSATSSSTAGWLAVEEIDVPLGPLSMESIFLVIPDIDNFDNKNQREFHQNDSKGNCKSRRDEFVCMLKNHAPNINDVHWQNAKTLNRLWVSNNVTTIYEDNTNCTQTSLLRCKNKKIDALYLLTRAWRKGLVSNYDYLLRLNAISGRSFHDPGNYPVMPWVLSNFISQSVPDLSDARNYRDLTKPMGALCPERLEKFLNNYESLCSADDDIPPFMYGSHYSNTGGVVLHYLVRKKPFAGLHRQLQGGQFDNPDRLFRSVSRTWEKCSKTSSTVNELTPEWYSDPSFLKNANNFNLGTSVDGSTINDVLLPPWAENDAKKFVEVMRNALESDYCSSKLPSWIDLIFGYKQRGPEAEKANNVFYHLSYYDAEDLIQIQDSNLRAEIELHIADFGNCPSQLFFRPHPLKKADSNESKGELRIITGN